ncbi:MAG: aspartate kinase [Rickettsiales bacterium]|nr:aspartate kinase [Rickettsiales bacterium]|tara:strand:- start:442 stop:1662 length:1221 start_codon:yes stop_codon:yes gene_type:complete
MSIIVMKFGGTSISNLEKIKNIANRIRRELNKKKKVLVVVSAMGKTTDELAKKFFVIKKDIFNAEYDSVISTGEQLSAGLLAAFLDENEISARSILGWQIPIITDSFHGKARIIDIPTKFVKKLFETYDVLVLSGFQGISKCNRITTLGRGGSDTTAVAIAAVLKADICEIYTDVEGIYTADPRKVKKARKISQITYEEILEMSSLGSKVLQPRSVELAMKYDIKVHVRSSFNNKKGTIVISEEKNLEKALVTGISFSDEEAKITLIGIQDTPGVANKIFSPLASANINVDMIVQNITDDGRLTSLTFTVANTECEKAVKKLKSSNINFNKIHVDKKISKVSIIGVGMRSHVGVAKKMFETLAKNNINIQVISTSEIKISVLISSRNRNVALNALHKVYGLDKSCA